MKAFIRPLFQHRFIRLASYTYLAYLLVCVLIISPLLTWGLGKLYQQQTGRNLEHGLVSLNPFNLAITAHNLQDNNPDGSLLWSTDRLTLNLSLLQSLAHLSYTLDEIAIDNLFLHPQIVKNGKWNFEDILQHQKTLASTATKPSTPAEKPIAVAINNIVLSSATFEFSDLQQSTAFHSRLENIQFTLNNFSTATNQNQTYNFHAGKTETGELKIAGQLHADNTQGELLLSNINLLPVWQYFKNDLNFTLEAAKLNGKSQFDLQWKDNFNWSIKQTELSLTNTKLRSGKKDARNAELSLAKLQVKNVSAASRNQLISIANVQLDGLQLGSWNQGGDTGLARAFALKNTTPSSDTSPPWEFAINTLTVNNAAVDWKAGELNNHPF